MGLFGEIEPVPYRLLDELEAQMEANRERLDGQQELKGMTRPRPQRSVFNATMGTYRRPEPAAHPARGMALVFLRVVATPDGPDQNIADLDLVTQSGQTIRMSRPFTPVDTTGKFVGGDGWTLEEDITPNWQYNSIATGYKLWAITNGGPSQAAGFDNRYILPVGGETGIIVVHWMRGQFYSYLRAEQTETSTHTIGFDGVSPVTSVESQVNVNTLAVTEQIFSDLSETSGMRAFVFNRSSIREVAVPAGLGSVLDLWYPTNTVIDVPGSFTRTFIIPGTESNVTYEDATIAYDAPAWSNPPKAIYLAGLLTNYGFANISAAPGRSGTTPALFSSIEIYRSEIPPFEMATQNRIYESVRPLLIAEGASMPQRYIEAGFGADFDTGVYRWTTDAPTGNSGRLADRLPLESLQQSRFRNPVGPRSDLGANVTEYLAWDWGNPSYCRQRALALGFTPGDLRP